jgi:heme-degrading monooxygenase HmoA
VNVIAKFAVIFKAVINQHQLDSHYFETARGLRELAKTQYGCLDFVSVREDDREIAISYWPSREQISAWKDDPEHRKAQQLGRTLWYRSYSVEVVNIERAYTVNP